MSKKKWIQEAVKRKGALHRDLGVPEGQDIPEGKLSAALSGKYGKKTAARARLAKTLKGMNKG